jgi:hypothetical protein
MVLAAIAAVAIARTHMDGFEQPDEPEHAELATLAGGAIVGDQPERTNVAVTP